LSDSTEAIHYHAGYCSDVAYNLGRYAALVKGIDTQVDGIAKQAKLTSGTISQLEKVFQEFADQKGKMPRKRNLPKVEVLFGLIQKCSNLLGDIDDLIYRQVDDVVIPQNERPNKELNPEELGPLREAIRSAVNDIQLYTSNLDIQITLFFGILHDQ
jgi:hypothetical protein